MRPKVRRAPLRENSIDDGDRSWRRRRHPLDERWNDAMSTPARRRARLAAGSRPPAGGSADAAPRRRRPAPAADPEGIDDGTKLTLWTRAPLEAAGQGPRGGLQLHPPEPGRADHHPQRRLPDQARRGRRQRGLPDLFAADIVFVPELDLSRGCSPTSPSRIDALPVKARSTRGTWRAGTYEDQKYVLPFVLDLSVILYNKELYERGRAGPGQAARPPWTSSRSTPGHRGAGQRRERHLLRRQLRRLRGLHLVPDRSGPAARRR